MFLWWWRNEKNMVDAAGGNTGGAVHDIFRFCGDILQYVMRDTSRGIVPPLPPAKLFNFDIINVVYFSVDFCHKNASIPHIPVPP